MSFRRLPGIGQIFKVTSLKVKVYKRHDICRRLGELQKRLNGVGIEYL